MSSHDNWKLEKDAYDQIEIPEELSFMVRRTIAADRKLKAAKRQAQMIRIAGTAAALIFATATIGLNSSYAFAKTAAKVPVLGPVAKVLTVRKYEAEKAADSEYQAELLAEQNTVGQPLGEDNSQNTPVDTGVESGTITVSGSDTAVTLENWAKNMTLDQLNAVTTLFAGDGASDEMEDTILLAQLPKDQVYLYGYHINGSTQGVMVRVGNDFTCFGWTYMNEQQKLPEISYQDTDGDGSKEVVVLLYNMDESVDIKATETTDTITNTSTDTRTDTSTDIITDTSTDTTSAVTTTANSTPSEKKEELSDPKLSVSANDTQTPEEETITEENVKTFGKGELWTVSIATTDGTTSMKAGVFSENDYMSQMERQVQPMYDSETGELQLYLMEETLGAAVSLKTQAEAGRIYEDITLESDVEYVLSSPLSIIFKVGVLFTGEDADDTILPALQADISYDGDSYTLTNIRVVE